MGTDHHHALRELVGAGRSRLSIVGAMRARDASRPSPDQIAAAERRAGAIVAARLAGRARWRPPAADQVAPIVSAARPDQIAPAVPAAAPTVEAAPSDQVGSGGRSPVRS